MAGSKQQSPILRSGPDREGQGEAWPGLTCRVLFTPEVRHRLLRGAAVQPDAKLLWRQGWRRLRGAEPTSAGREGGTDA